MASAPVEEDAEVPPKVDGVVNEADANKGAKGDSEGEDEDAGLF